MPEGSSTVKNKSKLITKKKMHESLKPHNSPSKLFRESSMTRIYNWGKRKPWFRTSRLSSIKLSKGIASKSKDFMRKSGNSGPSLNLTTLMNSCHEPPKPISIHLPKPNQN
jgi:hypothetical protein